MLLEAHGCRGRATLPSPGKLKGSGRLRRNLCSSETYCVLGLAAGTCLSVLLFIIQQKKHSAETVPLRFRDLLKVTQRVSFASNPRPLGQVRKRPRKAKEDLRAQGLPWAQAPLRSGWEGQVCYRLCL